MVQVFLFGLGVSVSGLGERNLYLLTDRWSSPFLAFDLRRIGSESVLSAILTVWEIRVERGMKGSNGVCVEGFGSG